MENKEEFYDTRINPLVSELIKVCQEGGIPMFMTFQLNDACFCTSALSTGHAIIDHHRALIQCAEGDGVNIDKYIKWVATNILANGKGHSSMFLKVAGIPVEPVEPVK